MEELSNSEIRAAGENDGKFRLLYEHYSPYVWRVVFRTVHGDSYMAEQVLQSVFIAVHRNLRKFKFKSSFSTWLYQIAWRECLHHLKKQKRESGRFKEINEKDLQLSNDESAKEKVDTLLEQLSQEERFLLVSKEIDGFSFDELAVITGKKSGALRTAVSRIKQKIREVSHG